MKRTLTRELKTKLEGFKEILNYIKTAKDIHERWEYLRQNQYLYEEIVKTIFEQIEHKLIDYKIAVRQIMDKSYLIYNLEHILQRYIANNIDKKWDIVQATILMFGDFGDDEKN